MYNRYIPQPDGSYRRSRMDEPIRHEPRHNPPPRPKPPRPEPAPSCVPQPPVNVPCRELPPRRPPQKEEWPIGSFLKNLLPKDLDTGDLMVILLLLLMAGDCEEDRNNALLTLAIYLFM